MDTNKAEQERKQYNDKLLNETFRGEIKKPHRTSWSELAAVFFGTMLGLFLQDVINTEKLISNSVAQFCVDVLIVVIAITAVQGIIALVKKLTAKKQS